MSLPAAFALAVVLLLITSYAQVNVARFTASPVGAAIARVILLAVGGALGYIATGVAETPLLALLYFVIALGIVHVPAAFILLMKRAGGAGRS